MEELGYLDDPADRLGMLDGQRMRAARVVLDIGVHLGKPTLDGHGHLGRTTTRSPSCVATSTWTTSSCTFEVNRYLGWPGQAPSYKVGQRIWEQIRDEAQTARRRRRSRSRTSTSAPSTSGGVGLDTLKSVLLA